MAAGPAWAQGVQWFEVPIDQTQTLSVELPFGREVTLVTKIAAADLKVRALATHSLELVDGTVMAAILLTQPTITFADSGGAFTRWQSGAHSFHHVGTIPEDDFALTLSLPAVEGADFTPAIKIEMVLEAPTPDTGKVFLETAELSSDVRGATAYGLADFTAGSLYPNADMDALVTLRDLPNLSMARAPGRCQGAQLVRTMYARENDMVDEVLANFGNFPQQCWRARDDGLRFADVAGNEGYQPDIGVRLPEDGGDLIGFVYGATTGDIQRVFIQNTAAGWLYGSGQDEWQRIGNGSWVSVPFGEGQLVIRNPRGGETADATENDAFVSYLLN